MAAGNSLDLERDPRAIIGTREFDAPRDLVFAAFADPEHLAQWWGPIGFRTTTLSFDMRPGGVWRFVMHGPDGRDYQNRITYEEVSPPERLVYRHGGGDDVEPVQFRQTIIFADLGGRTRMTWRGDFPSASERARVIKEYGADKGLVETLGRLAEYVASRTEKGAAIGRTAVEQSMLAKTNSADFVISRVFDAPRELVWQCFTEPERMKEWWGPKGSVIVASNMDFRVSGSYHGAMRAADGPVMWAKFTYREIVARERLVWVHSFSDEAGGLTRHPMSPTWPLKLLTTVTFEDAPGGKTKLTLCWSPLDAADDERKTFGAAHDSMRGGWGGSFDRLDAYLAGAR